MQRTAKKGTWDKNATWAAAADSISAARAVGKADRTAFTLESVIKESPVAIVPQRAGISSKAPASSVSAVKIGFLNVTAPVAVCLLYTSDAADE